MKVLKFHGIQLPEWPKRVKMDGAVKYVTYYMSRLNNGKIENFYF